MMPGRKQPYTEIGIRRLPCARCGKPARFQWQICSDGNLYRPLCLECDIALNTLVLRWIGDPEANAKIAAYRLSKGGEMITHVRDLSPGDRFYLLRTMDRFTYLGVRISDLTGMRLHAVEREDGKHTDLHHSCRVKRIVRAE